MTPPEKSHVLKIKRGHEHLENLNSEIINWVNSEHCSARIESDPADPTKLVMFASSDPIPAEPFSLLIGDIIQNFRSALDHIVFELSELNPEFRSKNNEKIPQFPIFSDGDEFSRKGKFRLKFLKPEAQEIIIRLQPYNADGKDVNKPLWLLNELSNMDKHRLVHLSAMNLEGIAVHPDFYTRFNYEEFFVTGGRVETDTIVGWMRINPKPGIVFDETKDQIGVTPAITIAFSDGPAFGQHVVRVLDTIEAHIRKEIISPLEAFF